jgi:hypothetical protein
MQLLEDLQQQLTGIAQVERVPPENALGGPRNWDEAQRLIQDCQVFAVVLSPSALASPRINAEIDLAWRQRSPNRAIVPILYRESPVREDLDTVQMSSFLPPKSYDEALSELVARFHSVRDQLRRYALQTAEPPAESVAPATNLVAPSARRTLRPPSLSRAQRQVLLACGAAIVLLVTSIGLVNEVNYQQQQAQQRAQAAHTATAKAQWTQTISAIETQSLAQETVAAATQAVLNVTATAQVYAPYASKSPTCDDQAWSTSTGKYECTSDGVIVTTVSPPGANYSMADMQFNGMQANGAHTTLTFDYEMDVTITPLQGDVSMYISNGYYIIQGQTSSGFFGMDAESTGGIPTAFGTFPSTAYVIKYRYDGHKMAVYVNGNLLYSLNVVLTFSSMSDIYIELSPMGGSGPTTTPVSAKISNFSFIPIR